MTSCFQEDAKYEHVGQDTRSQGGKDDQDKQGKDLEISKSKTKSKDNDKGSRPKIPQLDRKSLHFNKRQDSRLNDKAISRSSKEARFKISPQEFEDHTLGEIVSLKTCL
ncbi:hypothetical protein Tco_1499260 [Tanacetum coccineum]